MQVKRRLLAIVAVALVFQQLSPTRAQAQSLPSVNCVWFTAQIQRCEIGSAGTKPNFFNLLDSVLSSVGYLFPSTTARPFERSIAFLVGVSRYTYLIPQLPYVRNDIDDMRDYMLGRGGFDVVYTVTDDAATPEVVTDFMLNRLSNPKVLGERDRLLFYFAGHGDALQGSFGYMQFGAAKPKDFARGVIRMDDIQVWSRTIRARDVLFLIDACASGLAISARRDSRPDPSTTFLQLLKTFSDKGSRTLITAGTADQSTYEVRPATRNRGNGVFTRAFLDAAQSVDTDHGRRGFLTIDEIFAEAKVRVIEFASSAEHGVQLTPDIQRLQQKDYPGTFTFLSPAKPEQGSAFQKFAVQIGLVKRGGPTEAQERAGALAELQAWKIASAAESALSFDTTLALRLAQASYLLYASPFAEKVLIQAYNSSDLFYERLYRGIASADIEPGGSILLVPFPYSSMARVVAKDSDIAPIVLHHGAGEKVVGGLFSSDGAFTWTTKGVARYWDRSGGLVSEAPLALRDVDRPCVTGDGSLIVGGSGERPFAWNPRAQSIHRRPAVSNGISFEIPERRCAPAADAILEFAPGRPSASLLRPDGSVALPLRTVEGVTDGAISRDGRIIALAVRGALAVYVDGSPVPLIDLPSEVSRMSFSPEGHLLAVAGLDGWCRLVRLERQFSGTWSGVATDVAKEYRAIDWVAFGPKADRIAVARRDGVVNIYSLDGSPVHRLAGHKAGDGLNRSIARLVWDATGGRILTVGRDLTARLWSTQSARVLAFRGDGLEFEEFNHQGDRLAAWSARERVVRLMDLKGRIVRELPGHKSFIRTVRFSRDDRTVVTHSNDSIRIWRDDQSEPLTIRAEASALFTGRVEFNSNETHLVMIDPSARDTPKLAWRLNGGMPVPLADAGEVPARPATTSKWRLDWAVTELGQGFWLSNAATGIRFFLKSQLVFAGTVDASSEVDQHGYAHVDGLGETGFHVFLVDADSINRALRSEDLYGRLWAIDDETYRRYDIW